MKTLFVHRLRFQPWGITLVAVLVTSYFTLMVGAIYCQYYLQQDDYNHHTASYPISSKTHCLMAKHGTMATTLSGESTESNPLQFLTLVLTPGPVSIGSGVVIVDNARAPPLAFSTSV